MSSGPVGIKNQQSTHTNHASIAALGHLVDDGIIIRQSTQNSKHLVLAPKVIATRAPFCCHRTASIFQALCGAADHLGKCLSRRIPTPKQLKDASLPRFASCDPVVVRLCATIVTLFPKCRAPSIRCSRAGIPAARPSGARR